jgi:hypothetical protein
MKLYQWSSSLLRDYSNGIIASFGTSVADARKRVIKSIKAQQWNEKSKAEYIEEVKHGKPTEVEGDVLFLSGSA